MHAGPFALRAAYLFTGNGPPLRDGLITIAGQRIVAVGENTSGRSPRDLGSVAIMPGLINAHTHLEFSALRQPLGQLGSPFPEWIRAVIALRRGGQHLPDAGVMQGLAQSVAQGTTTLGEIATSSWPLDLELSETSALDLTAFFEVIGLRASSIAERLQLASDFLTRAGQTPNSHIRRAISPHAPYTVHPELLDGLVQLAQEHQVPLAMHLAETLDEIELLHSGSGPLRDLLVSLEAWDATAIGPGSRPLDYLRQLAAAPRALVIHGNYLAGDEIEFIAAHRSRLAVVYCPRTHAYFSHSPYPLAKMLAAGVNVALGTDSRASNPDLSLLGEMREIHRRHPEIDPTRVVQMGTSAGAQALGCQQSVGSLTPGMLANLAVVSVPAAMASKDPYELLLASDEPNIATLHCGRWVYQDPRRFQPSEM